MNTCIRIGHRVLIALLVSIHVSMSLLALRSSTMQAVAVGQGKHLFSKSSPLGARKLSTTVPDDETHAMHRPMKNDDFRVVRDKMVYHGWRSVKSKAVQYPDGEVHDFDVMTTNNPSVFVFPWDTRSKTTTLVREFHPGLEKVMYGVVAGMYESDKHADAATCAKFELEEEAGVSSARWVPLLQQSTGFDKYSDARLLAWLALDCNPVANPRAQDAEEYIQVRTNVTHQQVLDLILQGEINVPSAFTCMLAFDQLRRMNMPLE